jgi:hypothetical protein
MSEFNKAELFEKLNGLRVAAGRAPLKGWKKSTAALAEAVAAFGPESASAGPPEPQPSYDPDLDPDKVLPPTYVPAPPLNPDPDEPLEPTPLETPAPDPAEPDEYRDIGTVDQASFNATLARLELIRDMKWVPGARLRPIRKYGSVAA